MPTFEDDFTSDNWTTEDSNVLNIDTTNNHLNFIADGSVSDTDVMGIDIGENISTKFICRFSVDFTTLNNTGGAGTKVFMGLANAIGYSNSGNYLGFKIRAQASTADDMGIDIGENDDWAGGGVDVLHNSIPSVTKYYVEIKRTAMNNVVLSLFADSDWTNLVESALTSSVSVSGLRYFIVGAKQGTNYSSDIVGKLDDLVLYNGVDTIPTEQRLRVMFYPNNNVQNPIGSQRLRVMFYPNNNVQATSSSSPTWRWWVGMRGKKRYGNKAIRRVSL
jgi:hypothetical protein